MEHSVPAWKESAQTRPLSDEQKQRAKYTEEKQAKLSINTNITDISDI